METIHAENVLEQIPLNCYSDLKKETQRKIDKSYSRAAKAHRESDLKTLTPEELAYGLARKHIDG